MLLYLDDIETHVDNVLGAGAVVSGSWVAFEGVAKVATVQVVVAQVIVASPVSRRQQEGPFLHLSDKFDVFHDP